ncbi:MAG: DNA replication/repair protein RecF [Clostridia bacterium]
MQLKELHLVNFTNYSKEEVAFGKKITILVGENAQGKTNLLDAISYLSSFSGRRGRTDAQLVQEGTEHFQLQGIFLAKGNEHKLQITYYQGKKQIIFNEQEMKKVGEATGKLQAIFFSPDDLYLFKGAPAMRRSFLDHEVMQAAGDYYFHYEHYRKNLASCNAYLKQCLKKYARPDDLLLSVWLNKLAEHGTAIVEARLAMLRKLRPLARLAHRKMTEGKEEMEIVYVCSLVLEGEQLSKESFVAQLEASKEENRLRGMIMQGPHRDDLTLLINGKSAKEYASQGQHRTAVLALKLASLESIYAQTGEYPLLLLDDVLSELDAGRREQLMQLVNKKIQTIISCTGLELLQPELLAEADILPISQGKISLQV